MSRIGLPGLFFALLAAHPLAHLQQLFTGPCQKRKNAKNTDSIFKILLGTYLRFSVQSEPLAPERSIGQQKSLDHKKCLVFKTSSQKILRLFYEELGPSRFEDFHSLSKSVRSSTLRALHPRTMNSTRECLRTNLAVCSPRLDRNKKSVELF